MRHLLEGRKSVTLAEKWPYPDAIRVQGLGFRAVPQALLS